MPRPGRNDPCPCGSGKKFKQCCASKKDHCRGRSSRCSSPAWFWRLIVIVSNARRPSNSGMVWSPEHGHYHDASGREVPR